VWLTVGKYVDPSIIAFNMHLIGKYSFTITALQEDFSGRDSFSSAPPITLSGADYLTYFVSKNVHFLILTKQAVREIDQSA
jgi:hypothetical protein